MKPPPSAFVAAPYSQAYKPKPQRQYISYYYPHRTHYRDWSRKVLQASAYARKWQIARKQKLLLRKQKANKGGAGIKLFVAGINQNGNVHGKWIDQNNFQNPNDQKNQELARNKPLPQNVAATTTNAQSSVSTQPIQQSSLPVATTNLNSGLPSSNPAPTKLKAPLLTNPPDKANQFSPTQGNANSVAAAVGTKNPNPQSQAQSNSLPDKGSLTKTNFNGGILSDNLGGAVLGPNAHSLLQSATLQQTPGGGTAGNRPGGVGSLAQSKTNLSPKVNSMQNHAPPKSGGNANTNLQNNNIPMQEQGKNVLSSNNQHHQINQSPGNEQGNLNLAPQRNTAPPPNANLAPALVQDSKPEAGITPVPGIASTVKNGGGTSGAAPGSNQITSISPQMKTTQSLKGLALETANIDKTTAQKLNAGLTTTPVSRPPPKPAYSQPSNMIAAPNNRNLASQNSAPANTNPNQDLIKSELALKNLLFPPPSTIRNQVSGYNPLVSSNEVPKNVSPQQMVPSFPAFRYDAKLPVTGQTGFNTYRRNNIPHVATAPNNPKSLVPQHGPVPYKSSFPLTLHKISPYFKMKRNLKQMSSEPAKARRRFLELQSKC